MHRRRWLLGAAVAGLSIMLGIVALWWFLADGITPANAARITPGTSLKDVNRLLGQQGCPVDTPLSGATGENHYVWEGSLGSIHVAFQGDLTTTDPVTFTPTDSTRSRLRCMFP